MNYKNNLKSFSKMLIVTFAIVSLVGGTSPFGLVSVAEAGNGGKASSQKTYNQKNVKKPSKEAKKTKSPKKINSKKISKKKMVVKKPDNKGHQDMWKDKEKDPQTPPAATSTSVILCKEDSEGNQLEGWTLYLDVVEGGDNIGDESEENLVLNFLSLFATEAFASVIETEGHNFAGVTEENGCVTFPEVEFGTYQIGEEMKEGWENVSGLDEVVVNDEEGHSFFITNEEIEVEVEEPPVVEEEKNETPVVKATKRSGRVIPQEEEEDKAPEGQVLGATTEEEVPTCGQYLTSYLRYGYDNDTFEVTKLQLFLKSRGFDLDVTGEFDLKTDKAVHEFQLSYTEDILTPWEIDYSTGYVYKTTKWKINNIICPLSEEFPSPLI